MRSGEVNENNRAATTWNFIPDARRLSAPTRASLRERCTTLMIVVFMVLLWLPTLDFLLKLDPSPVPIENRVPAKFPVFDGRLVGARKYVAGLESWFNDHFGFRKSLIRAHAWFQRRCFHEGGPDVVVGRGDWLFFAGDHALDYHLGLSVLNSEKLRAWQRLFETRKTWLDQQGIKYLLVIPPNKETVYPEYLPGWANKPNAVTGLDRFLEYMKSHSTIEILDLLPPLIEAKQSARTYLFTDTHWNYYGAFVAYRAIVTALAGQLAELEPLQFGAFDAHYTTEPGGDLARMLAQEQTMPEKEYVTLIPRPPLPVLKVKNDRAILEQNQPPNEQPTYTENAAKNYKAVMFHDSFGDALMPFLGYHFRRIVFIRQRAWDLGVIQREKPDLVIDEVLERYLDWPIPER